MEQNNPINRRKFIKTTAGMALAVSGIGCTGTRKISSLSLHPEEYLTDDTHDPIQVVAADASQDSFSGDNPTFAHSVLWNIDEYKKNLPKPDEEVDVAIIGGGMSGLLSAYKLKDKKTVLFDQAQAFGGNSRGEQWYDTKYGLGAAYFVSPEVGTDLHSFLKEIGVLELSRVEMPDSGAAVWYKDKLSQNFWEGPTDPKQVEEFRAFKKYLTDFANDGVPEIPFDEQFDNAYKLKDKEKLFYGLDSMSVANWITNNFPKLHPHIKKFIEEYCFASFNASVEEVAVSQFLNFLPSEFLGTITFPAGNATITKKLYEIMTSLGLGLRANSLVFDVRPVGNKVQVSWIMRDGKVKSLLAKQCIVSCPKFVAKKIVTGMSAAQIEAIGKIRYRAYLVGSILLKKPFKTDHYGVLRLEMTKLFSKFQKFSDFVHSSWAEFNSKDHSVITIYKPMPYDGARADLMSPKSFETFKTQFQEIALELVKVLKISKSDIAAVRIARWGHATPVPDVSMVANKTVHGASQSISDKIHFCAQDNWVNASFETCFGTANACTSFVRKKLEA